MSNTERLNELIREHRNALIVVGVLSLLSLITSLERIELGASIVKYDYHLLEYFFLDHDGELPVELGDDLEPYTRDELGLSKLPFFAQLAQIRYALPASFHDQLCRENERYGVTENGWRISIDDAECELYKENFYKMPKGKRESYPEHQSSDIKKGFPMPRDFYEDEDWESFDEKLYINNLTCADGLLSKSSKDNICKHCGGDVECDYYSLLGQILTSDYSSKYTNLLTCGKEFSNKSCCKTIEELDTLDLVDKDIIEENEANVIESVSPQLFNWYMSEYCYPAYQLSPAEYLFKEKETIIPRLHYQIKNMHPSKVTFSVSHQDGISGSSKSTITISNENEYWSKGCRPVPGEFVIESEAFPRIKQSRHNWCPEGKNLVYIRDQLELVINKHSGPNYSPNQKRDYAFYSAYLYYLENEHAKTVSVPFVGVAIKADWLVLTSYIIILFLLTWVDTLNRRIYNLPTFSATIPWTLDILKDYLREDNPYHKAWLMYCSVLPILTIRILVYFLPAFVLGILIFVELDNRVGGGRIVDSISLVPSIALFFICLIVGSVAAVKERQIMLKIKHNIT